MACGYYFPRSDRGSKVVFIVNFVQKMRFKHHKNKILYMYAVGFLPSGFVHTPEYFNLK